MITLTVALETFRKDWSDSKREAKIRRKTTTIRLPAWDEAAFLKACKRAFGIRRYSGWRQVSTCWFNLNPESWQRGAWMRCAHVMKETSAA